MNIRITCRGVSHTPECACLSTWMFSGRMRYAPTFDFCGILPPFGRQNDKSGLTRMSRR